MRSLLSTLLPLLLVACTTPEPPPPAAAAVPHPDPSIQAAVDREVARRQARVYKALHHIQQGDACLNANDPEKALTEYRQGLNQVR